MTPRLALRKILPALMLGPLVAALPLPAHAGNFSVSPVRIYMSPRDRATAITIVNEGDEELVMQADIYDWKQKPGGNEDNLVLSEDLFVAPPIIKLAPRARQVVRLAMVKPVAGPDQVTYRLFIRELVEAREAKNLEVNIALAFSIPVFITPPNAKNDLACEVAREGRDAVSARCENKGNAHALVRELALDSGAARLVTRDSPGYILPGIRRSFEMKRTGGPIPAGPAKLAVTLDDGSIRTFDVTISE